MIATAHHGGATISGSPLRKLSEKGTTLSLNSGPRTFPCAFVERVGQRVSNCVSTRKFVMLAPSMVVRP